MTQACPCGRKRGEYEACPDPQCTRREGPLPEEAVERLVNQRANEIRDEERDEVAKVVSLPTRPDEMLRHFSDHLKLMKAAAENAAQIARTKRALYLAYVKEGFEPGQAMLLIQGPSPW